MLANVLRDAELVDFARDAVAPLQAYLEEAAKVLAAGRRRRLARHALAFSTWRSLSANGIGRKDAVRLMTTLVEG
jgi:ABC-type transport system involved in cytochrome bd biosynthesis fused ATPase/permease subunit